MDNFVNRNQKELMYSFPFGNDHLQGNKLLWLMYKVALSAVKSCEY